MGVCVIVAVTVIVEVDVSVGIGVSVLVGVLAGILVTVCVSVLSVGDPATEVVEVSIEDKSGEGSGVAVERTLATAFGFSVSGSAVNQNQPDTAASWILS